MNWFRGYEGPDWSDALGQSVYEMRPTDVMGAVPVKDRPNQMDALAVATANEVTEMKRGQLGTRDLVMFAAAIVAVGSIIAYYSGQLLLENVELIVTESSNTELDLYQRVIETNSNPSPKTTSSPTPEAVIVQGDSHPDNEEDYTDARIRKKFGDL